MAYPSDAIENEISKSDRLRRAAMKRYVTGDTGSNPEEFTTNKEPKKKKRKPIKTKKFKHSNKAATTPAKDNMENPIMDYQDVYPDSEQEKKK